MKTQYVIVNQNTGEVMYRSDGTPFVIELPEEGENGYTLEWKEIPIENPIK